MIFHGVPLTCINHAAITYHVPAKLIISVIEIEGGRNGMAIKNKNGTYDLGVMQVNSIWVPKIKYFGITKQDLQFNPCTNVTVGSWILAKGMATANGWQGIGNYHSITSSYNQRYREKVKSTSSYKQR
jgi:soluble lytic murein transglycosylase-like protein